MKKLMTAFAIMLCSIATIAQTITATNTGTSVHINYAGAGLSTSTVTVSDLIAEYPADGVDFVVESRSCATCNFWSTQSGVCEFYGNPQSQLVGGKLQYWAVVGIYQVTGNDFNIPYNVQPSYGVGIFSDGKQHQLRIQWYSPQVSMYAPTYNGIFVTTESMPYVLPAATCAPAWVAAHSSTTAPAPVPAQKKSTGGKAK